MPRKASLKVVSPTVDPPLPAGLGPAGTELWEAIARDFVIADAADAATLTAACKTADLAAALEAELDEAGLVGPAGNQLTKHLLGARALQARLLKTLTAGPSRPPGRPGGGPTVGLT